MSHRNRVFKSWQVVGEPFDLDTRYKVTDYLGSGAYGMVCAVHDYQDNSNVAIKKCKKIYQSRTLAKRTLREIRLLRQFNHENIVKLKSILLPPDLRYYTDLYLVFEIMDTDLAQIIRSPQQLKEQHTQYFIYQLLRALEYLHSKNIVHRDIKPRNILINADCTLKVADFGLARMYTGEGPESVVAITDYVTTRWYRAPEVIVGWSRYTAAIDMWAVGCIVAELLARAPLFPGENTMKQLGLIIRVMGCPGDGFILRSQKAMFRQYMMTLLNRRATDLSLLVPTASPEAIDLIRRLLDYDPSRRPNATQCLAHPFIASMSTSLSPPVCSPMCIAPEEFEFEQRKLSIDDLRAEIALEIAYYNQEVVEQLVMDTLEPAPSPSPVVSPLQSPHPTVDLDIADMPEGYADPAVAVARATTPTGAASAAKGSTVASAESKIPTLHSATNLTLNPNARTTAASAALQRQHRSARGSAASAHVSGSAEDSVRLPGSSTVASHQHAPLQMPSYVPSLPQPPGHPVHTGSRQDSSGQTKLPGQKGPAYPSHTQHHTQSKVQYQQGNQPGNQPYAGLGPARGFATQQAYHQRQQTPPYMQPLPYTRSQAPQGHYNASALAGAHQSGVKLGGNTQVASSDKDNQEEDEEIREEIREVRRDVDALLRGDERSYSGSSELQVPTHTGNGPAVAAVQDASDSDASDNFADAVLGTVKADAQEVKVCDLPSPDSADRQQQYKQLPQEQGGSHFVADYTYSDAINAVGDIESATAVSSVPQGGTLTKQPAIHNAMLSERNAGPELQRETALQRDRSRTYSEGIHRRSATASSPTAPSHTTTSSSTGVSSSAGRARSHTTSTAPLSRESNEHSALMAGYFTCFRDQHTDGGDHAHPTSTSTTGTGAGGATNRLQRANADEEEGKWEDGYDACDYTQGTRHSSAGGAGSGRYPPDQPGGYADRRNVWENIASSCTIS